MVVRKRIVKELVDVGVQTPPGRNNQFSETLLERPLVRLYRQIALIDAHIIVLPCHGHRRVGRAVVEEKDVTKSQFCVVFDECVQVGTHRS